MSYSEGFNPPFGGAFAFERSGAQELEPEFATNYEVGIRSAFREGRGLASATVYLLERRDLVQTLRIEGINTQVNAGGLDASGLELDVSYRFGTAVSLSANYAYTDTEWREFSIRGTSFAGFELIQNPKHLASISLDWQPANGRWAFGAFVDYVGERFADRSNTVELDSYTLVNVQAAYRPSSDDRFTIRLHGFNLLDEEYLSRTELDFVGGILGGAPGRPASWLASLSVRY